MMTSIFELLIILINLINQKMKKLLSLIFLVIFSVSASTAFAGGTEKKSDLDKINPDKTENKLSEEELGRMTKRVEEIGKMDMSEMSGKEKRVLKKELKGIKENVRRDGGYIYIGGSTLLLIILLIILL